MKRTLMTTGLACLAMIAMANGPVSARGGLSVAQIGIPQVGGGVPNVGGAVPNIGGAVPNVGSAVPRVGNAVPNAVAAPRVNTGAVPQVGGPLARGGGGGVGRGGGGGGGVPHGGGGGVPHVGGGAVPHVGGGTVPHVNVPNVGAPRVNVPHVANPNVGASPRVIVPNVGAQPNFNRNPAFSQPHVNTPQVGPRNLPGAQINPGANIGAGVRGNANVQPHIGANAPGVVPRANVGANVGGNITNNANISPGAHLQNQAGIRANVNAGINNPALQGNAALRGQLNAQNGLNVNRHNLGGNTVVLNNRTVNLSNNAYRPAYNRHPQYMGYWNSPYGYGYGGFGNGFVNGLGFGLGQSLTGWGYGYGYPYGYGYGYRPLGWGYGAWGLGSLGYGSGYLSYYNPYYVNNYGTYGSYSYAQPIPVAYSSQPLVTGGANTCEQALDDAAAAFKQNDYDMALDILNKGVAQCPDDSVMHEFRALVLFAKGDYQQSAATIHSVLAVGPGWNWSTLSNLYGSVGTYTTQLRALEAFTISNPQDSASRFLLAYHYMVEGYPDATERQLRAVVQLTPNDRVASDLLRLVSKPSPEQMADPSQLPTPQPPAAAPGTAALPNSPTPAPNTPAPANNAPAFDPAILIGTWHASRPDGSKFELVFDTNSTFRWKFSMKEQSNEFTGKYSVEGNVLTLERNEGGSLIAGIIPSNDHSMNFKLIGAPAEDPGLDFQK